MALYDPELEVGTRLERCLIAVGSERKKQLLYQSQGKFKYTLSDPSCDELTGVACLGEELGEVSRAVLNRQGLANDPEVDRSDRALYHELSQIAALAVAWMEKLT
jgi:hypothetical protein